jgi:Flp pilus assembly protein TadG
MLRKARQKQPGRRGTVMVETALVLSMCLLLFFAIFEFGRFFMIWELMNNAAREGTRQAAVNTGSLATSDIQQTVTNYLAGQQLNNLNIQVYEADATGNSIGNWNDAAFGEGIAVQIDGDYVPLLPASGILPKTIHISVKSLTQSEAN